MQRLTDGLWYDRQTASTSVVEVRGRSGSAVEPMLRLRRAPMNGRRLHVDLVLLGGDRSVEVSFHPAATVDLVRGHAERAGADANGWMGALLGAVLDDADRWGSWTPDDTAASPLAVLGGVTHPLLGSAYDRGVGAAGEIPRWASPALAESSMAAAAVRLFGPSMATRAVTRAMGGLLVRPVVGWWQLAVASAITTTGRPDDVAAVLAAPSTEPAGLPSAEDVAVLRAGFSSLEPSRAKRLAVDALALGGACRLEAALRTLVEAGDAVRWPPPVRLHELEAVCLRATAIDPAPPRPAVPRLRPAVASESVTGRDAPMPTPPWAMARRAPATTGRTRLAGDATFTHPAAVRAIDRSALDNELELVLPRTPDELRAWGRMLSNCLGDFGPAVAEQRSVIFGVRQRGALVAAIELLPELRGVRQFLGVRNRLPPAAVVEPVLARLTPVPVGRLPAG